LLLIIVAKYGHTIVRYLFFIYAYAIVEIINNSINGGGMFDQQNGQMASQQPDATSGATIQPMVSTIAPTITPLTQAPANVVPPSANEDTESLAAPMISPDGTPTFSTPTPQVSEEVKAEAPGVSKDLLDIKKEALKELSPLVGQLNLPPEEKFKTLMMMIQASDDQDLVPMAYKTAHEITSENERAQALLDVINEINYFMQNK
jgi:hypothetical protein